MLARIVAKLTVFALRQKRLSGEQKALVTSALLENLRAFPIRDIITTDVNGSLVIKGKVLDTEQRMLFRESGAALRSSFTRRLIHDQMLFKAINIGVHQGQNTDAVVFSKAAIWVIQEENALIEKFTGEDDNDE